MAHQARAGRDAADIKTEVRKSSGKRLADLERPTVSDLARSVAHGHSTTGRSSPPRPACRHRASGQRSRRETMAGNPDVVLPRGGVACPCPRHVKHITKPRLDGILRGGNGNAMPTSAARQSLEFDHVHS